MLEWRQEYWAHTTVMLNAPGQQQGLREQLRAAGYWHYVCDPVPGDNRMLLLPCAAPVRGLDRYWVPFRPQLSATPCLTRECNVELLVRDLNADLVELCFRPPLVYKYDATQQQPGTRQSEVLELATHGLDGLGLDRNCKLQLRIHAHFKDATLQLGPYLLVHGVRVWWDGEVEHAGQEAREALDQRGEVQPEMMMVEGMLIDDPQENARVREEIARTAVWCRWDTMKRMEEAFKAKAAVRRICGAFKRWKWRKEVAWNPATALGRRLQQLRAEAYAAE